ncbi:MAG: hypothetical protein JXB36_11970 [Gammaproteobacteria bacterium]|nr:hypothetical protein [Gammaproteobacteria bacterium]
MSNNNENESQATPATGGSVADQLPNWPLEWVSSQGRFGGKVESLVLVHFSCTFLEHDRTKKSILLTARDRRRRAWTAALVMEADPKLDAIEAALGRSLYSRIGDVGAARLEQRPAEADAAVRAGVLIPLPVERARSRRVQPAAEAGSAESARRSSATR